MVSLVHCLQTGTVALQLEDGRVQKLLWGPRLLALSDHILRKVAMLTC